MTPKNIQRRKGQSQSGKCVEGMCTNLNVLHEGESKVLYRCLKICWMLPEGSAFILFMGGFKYINCGGGDKHETRKICTIHV